MSQMDIEAEHLERSTEWSKYTNTCVLYVSYIGEGLVKIGSSDCQLLQRELKHISSESQYIQWRPIKYFEISGRPIETIIHKCLVRFNASYNKQKEVYRPIGTLTEFVDMIKDLVADNDPKLKMTYMEKKIFSLKNEVIILKLKNFDC